MKQDTKISCKFIKIVCSSLLLTVALSVTVRAQEGKRYALIIGVGNYPESTKLSKLSADRDTKTLADDLKKLGWTVKLISDSPAADAAPKRDKILEALGVQASADTPPTISQSPISFLGANAKLGKDDLLLFYYGGHGLTSVQGLDYLMPIDVTRQEGQPVASSMIPLPWITEALRATGAGRLLLFIDACRNGAVTRGDEESPVLGTPTAVIGDAPIASPGGEAGAAPQSIVQFRSADARQYSHEMQQENSGVFSYYIHQVLADPVAMAEADVDQDGTLTLEELTQYVTSRTRDFVNNLAARKSAQVPVVDFQGPKTVWSLPMGEYDPTGLNSPLPVDLVNGLRQVLAGTLNRFRDMRGAVIETSPKKKVYSQRPIPSSLKEWKIIIGEDNDLGDAFWRAEWRKAKRPAQAEYQYNMMRRAVDSVVTKDWFVYPEEGVYHLFEAGTEADIQIEHDKIGLMITIGARRNASPNDDEYRASLRRLVGEAERGFRRITLSQLEDKGSRLLPPDAVPNTSTARLRITLQRDRRNASVRWTTKLEPHLKAKARFDSIIRAINETFPDWGDGNSRRDNTRSFINGGLEFEVTLSGGDELYGVKMGSVLLTLKYRDID